MESDNMYLTEPNRGSDVYRNYRPVALPVEVEKQLDFIDIAEDGHAIIGSSCLTGRYWRGSVWYFKNASLAPNKDLCDTGLECENTVCDGKFIDGSTKFVVGYDTGSLVLYELYKNEDDTTAFDRKDSMNDHSNGVTHLSVSGSKKLVLSAGQDLCIKLWDLEKFEPSKTFINAHIRDVTGAQFFASDDDIFASCGLDGAALLWDTRKEKLATVLIDEPNKRLSGLAWLNNNTLAVGTDCGSVSLIDCRTGGILKESSVLDRPVYRLLSFNEKYLAVCGDTHVVKVIDVTSDTLSVRYTDERHSDFVRDFAHDKTTNILYSCGWDKQVLAHELSA